MLSTTTVKSLSDLVDDSMYDFGSHIPSPALGEAGNQKIKGETGFAKIGLVFQIN
jgi:hypothetical protein